MGNEYTVTCSSHGNVVYRGSNRSDYDYYRNGSRQCSQCHSEDAEEERQNALRRARQRARDEEERVRRKQRELEQQERERQRLLEEQRKIERDREKQRLLDERREEDEAKRQEMRKDILQKTTQEIIEQGNKIKQSISETSNPFLQYKNLNTLQTVKDISKRVQEIAVVGEIVKERANEISNDLQQTLGDDYDIIKSEINRYKTYGEQMESMTDVFIEEFKNVFPTHDQVNIDEMTELHNISTETHDEDEKKDLKSEVEDSLNRLHTAIKNVEAKLFLMEQYYDKMMVDYQYFKTFLSLKEDELNSITSTFKSTADIICHLQRSVVDGTGDIQQLNFTEEYQYKDTCTEETGYKMKNAVITGAIIGSGGGLCVGAAGIAAVGALTVSTGGAAIAAIAGGAILGAGIGALVSLINPYEYKVTYATRTGRVSATSERIEYSGLDQAEALDTIINKIESCQAYIKMKEELQTNQDKADNKLYECKRLKDEIINIGVKLRKYKSEMKNLENKFESGEKVTQTQTRMIDRRLKTLSTEILGLIDTMK